MVRDTCCKDNIGLLGHQEKCSKIIIDYKAVTKGRMTGICCNWLAEVDIGSNPIIIILQPSKFIVTTLSFPLIALVIIMFQFYYHFPHSHLDPNHKYNEEKM